MLPEDDRTHEEILSRGPTRPLVPGESKSKPPVVPYLPATLSFVAALLAFCGLQIYSLMVFSWRWSISGVIVLFVGLLIGSCLQSYANRRAK